MAELGFVHLGFGPESVEYTQAWEEQRRVHAARFADEIEDTCLLLEHLPVYTAVAHRPQRAPARRHPRRRRGPRRQDHLARPGPAGRLPDHEAAPPGGRRRARPPPRRGPDPHRRRVRRGDHPGRGPLRRLGPGRPRRGAPHDRRPLPRPRPPAARRGVRRAAERSRVRPVQQPASAARTASSPPSASGSPRASRCTASRST